MGASAEGIQVRSLNTLAVTGTSAWAICAAACCSDYPINFFNGPTPYNRCMGMCSILQLPVTLGTCNLLMATCLRLKGAGATRATETCMTAHLSVCSGK